MDVVFLHFELIPLIITVSFKICLWINEIRQNGLTYQYIEQLQINLTSIPSHLGIH